jgi:hypothetical protein
VLAQETLVVVVMVLFAKEVHRLEVDLLIVWVRGYLVSVCVRAALMRAAAADVQTVSLLMAALDSIGFLVLADRLAASAKPTRVELPAVLPWTPMETARVHQTRKGAPAAGVRAMLPARCSTGRLAAAMVLDAGARPELLA